MAALINARYRIIRTLGANPQGSIFLVEDTLYDDARAALKTIHAGGLDDALLNNLRAEFYTLSRLQHPGIARVFDVGVIHSCDIDGFEGALFFTLEYIEGTDLFRFTETASWETIAALVFQLAHAMEYIHRHGLIHFDIKPANIIVTDAGQAGGFVKLIDFGFASPHRASIGQPLRGTLDYIAPELLRGDPYDHRVDLYSLGVTLYEVIMRHTPFHAATTTETIKQHLTQPVPVLHSAKPGMPAFFARLVETLLQKDPARRFGSAAELVLVLQSASPDGFMHEQMLDLVPVHRLVGREIEVSHLHRQLCDDIGAPAHETRRHPAVTFVTGESGIGKTALLYEVRLRAQTDSLLVFRTRCFVKNAQPYEPLLKMLRDQIAYIRSFGARGDRFLEHHREFLASVYGSHPGTTGDRIAQRIADPEQRLHFVDLWSRLFFDIESLSPFAAWIDNIDEADESTIELLTYIVRSAPRHRVKFFISGIADAAIAPFLNTLDGTQRELLGLSPLDLRAVGELVNVTLNVDDTPMEVARAFVAKLGGTPSILLEYLSQYSALPRTLRAAAFERDLRSTDVHERFDDIIREVYRRKVAQRKPEELFLLRVMSCFAAPVSLKLLQQVAPFTPLRVKQFHDILVNVGVIRCIENGTQCYFSQSRFKDFIYAALGEEKKMLHLLIADTMAADGADGSANAEIIGRHYKEAGSTEHAYPFFVTAAAQKRSQFALHESIALLNEACTLVPSEAIDIAVFEDLADCYSLVGDYPHAVLLYEQLRIETVEASKRCKYAKELGLIHTREGRFDEAYALLLEASLIARTPEEILGIEEELSIIDISRGRYGDAFDRCSSALLAHSDAGSSVAITGILNNLGIIHFYQNSPEDSAACFRRSIEILQHGHQKAKLISPYLNLGNVYSAQEQFPEAVRYWQIALALSQEVGNLQQEARAYNNIGIAAFNQGSNDEAAAQYEKAHEIFTRLGFLPGMALCLTNIGEVHLANAQYQKAMECWEKDLTLYETLHDEHGMIEVDLLLARVHLIFGRFAEAETLVDSAEVLLAGSTNTAQKALFHFVKGTLCGAAGGHTEAEKHLLEAVDLYTGAQDARNSCLASLKLADTERILGSHARSAERLHDIVRNAAERGYASSQADALVQLGVLSSRGLASGLQAPITYFTAAFEAIRDGIVTETTWSACYHLGMEYIRRGLHEKGARALHHAIQAMEFIASGIASSELRQAYYASHRRGELLREMRSGIGMLTGE